MEGPSRQGESKKKEYRKSVLEDGEDSVEKKEEEYPDKITEMRATYHEDEPMQEMIETAMRDKFKEQEEAHIRATTLPHDYQIRPSLAEKFKPLMVKEMIHSVLNDELGGKVYNADEAEVWTKSIANTVRNKVRDMGFERYKFLVQVVIGEQHGAGVKIGSRCLWDADSDSYASDVFLNESIFCMTVVFAIYFY